MAERCSCTGVSTFSGETLRRCENGSLPLRPEEGNIPGGGVQSTTIQRAQRELSLYNMFVSLEAFVQESIILLFPTPTCVAHTIAVLLQDYCAIYNAPRPPFSVPHTIYNIGNSKIVWRPSGSPLQMDSRCPESV